MSAVIILFTVVLALIVTIGAGMDWAFICVYLPTMVMLNQLPMISIPHLPFAAQYAPLYGILLGMMFRPEPLRLRLCSIDIIMILLLISATITSWNTEVFETGVNNFRNEVMRWFAPYFLARIVFRKLEMRKLTLNVLIVLIAIIFVLAAIEFRFRPYFYAHFLRDTLGLKNRIPSMAYERYGYFRVSGTVEHPIYFGNMFLVLLGMVAALAKTTGKKLTEPLIAGTLLACCGCIAMSISYTPYIGVIAGTAFFLTLVLVPWSRYLVLPGTLAVIIVIFGFSYHVAHERLGEKPEGTLQGSLYTRKLIISEGWKLASTAGPFGLGRHFGDAEGYDLESVDNTYLLFAMQRGWVYLSLWISIGVFIALRMTIAFAKVKHPSQIFPLAICTSTVLGLMVSMFTVWAVGLYTVIWLLMLGLSNTLIDLLLYPEAHPTAAVRRAGKSGARGQGVPPAPAGPPGSPAHATLMMPGDGSLS